MTDMVRADMVAIYPDRSVLGRMASVKRAGILSLVRDGGGLQHVILEADDETLVAALDDVHRLPDASMPAWLKRYADFSLRVDLAGERRYLGFTGMPDHTAMHLLNASLQRRLSGGLPTTAMVTDTWKLLKQMPGMLGRARGSRAVWHSILPAA